MMATDSKKPNTAARQLKVLTSEAGEGAACTTCHSNDWIWDEEVELVRAMNGVKQKVREARARGDEAQVLALREEFGALRSRMEKVRRKRLDSLGHYDYD
jgi:hypothetical protein